MVANNYLSYLRFNSISFIKGKFQFVTIVQHREAFPSKLLLDNITRADCRCDRPIAFIIILLLLIALLLFNG